MADEKIKKTAPKKPGLISKIGSFFKEAKSELSKVVWPTPKQTFDSTITVMVIVLISVVFIGVVDWLFKSGINLILSL